MCCAIMGELAVYIGGKLVSQPNLITIYMAYHPQKLSPEIVVLLQIYHTPAFSLKSLDFLFVRYCFKPGDNTYLLYR